MLIQIHVDGSDPPVGRVGLEDGEPAETFHGWLELMAVLSQIVERGFTAPAPQTQPPPADFSSAPSVR